MSVLSNYVLQKKRWEDLSLSRRMYGENEPPEMQLENMYELVSRTNGTRIEEPIFDQSDFSHSDRMYPFMMKPETKSRWDRQKRTYEQRLKQFGKIKRLAHANFMSENPDHPLAQGLAKTSYGQKVYSELAKHMRQQCQQGSTPQSGTGQSIHDEMQRDSVDLHGAKNQLVKFTSPETNEVFAALAMERDETGRIVDKTFRSTESQHELTYEYDSEGRLDAAYYSGKAVEAYAYNHLGQRIQSHVSAGDLANYTYNQAGQLLQAGTTTYRYNADGDLIEKNESGQITRYNYLTTGQLCEVILPDGLNIEYRFDENGLRTEKLINDKLYQRYHWADLTTLAAVEDSSGTTRFQYNENGDPVAMQKNDDLYLLATDQLGSVFTVADLTGNSLQEILYDSFGRMIQNSNSDHDLYLGFAAGLHDKDTGLIHFGYREYDPTIGRFITPDPLGLAGGDVDVYGYCLDDPINFYDRTGLAGESEETEAELADTVLNEINSTKAPSVTASEEYKKGNVEGSGIPKSRKPAKEEKAPINKKIPAKTQNSSEVKEESGYKKNPKAVAAITAGAVALPFIVTAGILGGPPARRAIAAGAKWVFKNGKQVLQNSGKDVDKVKDKTLESAVKVENSVGVKNVEDAASGFVPGPPNMSIPAAATALINHGYEDLIDGIDTVVDGASSAIKKATKHGKKKKKSN
ncbi:RHS repeat-associated core domain-containing protein [Desulfovibrio sp. UCD-KL4C]|uniref:RHS repeat domain-containing protein n=1 Tax=Desulfovibrio sp. UCD-KL4C TaxID=2578120 RepID=UPI0025C58D2A|nr:RHS repeat-associated core domain-containing protein [Desulfovibrio sp. UCD-KL4C]